MLTRKAGKNQYFTIPIKPFLKLIIEKIATSFNKDNFLSHIIILTTTFAGLYSTEPKKLALKQKDRAIAVFSYTTKAIFKTDY